MLATDRVTSVHDGHEHGGDVHHGHDLVLAQALPANIQKSLKMSMTLSVIDIFTIMSSWLLTRYLGRT
jgi:hypothetical protein